MSQSEFSTSDTFAPPRSLAERLNAEANGHAAVEAASFMAERFAPDLSPLAEESAEDGEPPEDPPPARKVAAIHERALLANRTLFAVLIFIALIPTVAVGFLLWQSGVYARWLSPLANEGKALEFQQASIASTAAPETILPKRNIELPPVGLGVPDAISGEAGKVARFAIALEGADELPERSIIAIRGLPEGTSFSAGRPYGETEWTLRPDEIRDLSLTLPSTASGQRALSIELVAADGRTIANAATRLEIVADPKSALILRQEDASRVGELMKHGRKMIDVGYIAGARSYFRRAAEAGSADAALALGATYDPSFIEQIGVHGIKPEMSEALAWYERAKELGSKAADGQLAERGRAAALGGSPVEAPSAVAPAGVVPATVDDPDIEWVEISDPVNVRTGPTPQADTIKVAERGAKYRATGRRGNWVQVTDPETAQVGWVYSRYIVTAEVPRR